ncbi:MAG: TolC family protein, partial [Bacteroidota bacterium]
MKYLFFTLAGLVMACFANAQEQEDLSLSQAIQIGLENNFDIQIEELNIEVAANNNNWGAAGRWPTVSFNLSQNNNFRDVDNPASFLQGLTISNDVTPAINVNWILFDGFSVNIRRDQLQKLENLTRGNAIVVIENAVQGIINQYYIVQLEQERLDVLASTFNLSKDRYEYIKLKGELGSAVTFDILQQKNLFLTDSTNLVNQEITFVNARRTLNLLMGKDVTLTYNLTDNLEV